MQVKELVAVGAAAAVTMNALVFAYVLEIISITELLLMFLIDRVT